MPWNIYVHNLRIYYATHKNIQFSVSNILHTCCLIFKNCISIFRLYQKLTIFTISFSELLFRSILRKTKNPKNFRQINKVSQKTTATIQRYLQYILSTAQLRSKLLAVSDFKFSNQYSIKPWQVNTHFQYLCLAYSSDCCRTQELFLRDSGLIFIVRSSRWAPRLAIVRLSRYAPRASNLSSCEVSSRAKSWFCCWLIVVFCRPRRSVNSLSSRKEALQRTIWLLFSPVPIAVSRSILCD